MDSYVEVKNLNGTSGRVPNDAATWKEFWEDETGRKLECAPARIVQVVRR